VLHQDLLASPISVVHAPDLGKGDVGLVHEEEKILREEVQQRARRLAGQTAVQIAGIILDTRAVAHLAQHLQVVEGPHPQPFRLQKPSSALQQGRPLLHVRADRLKGGGDFLPVRDVVFGREDRGGTLRDQGPTGDRIDLIDPLDLLIEKGDPKGRVAVGGVDLHDLAPNPEDPRLEGEVVPLVVASGQPQEEGLPIIPLSQGETNDRLLVVSPLAQAVNAGDACHHEHVSPFQQAFRRLEPQLFDFVVDRGILLDVEILRGKIGLGLIVVVIADEVADRIIWEELSEFAV